ncbi:unnamed protein product [Linum trigynum]|uniref:Uncharacterized protein n=1 Tax=Linum trigynum TaxID=586398 RepID=A0AAV2D0N5_9ROSI
MGRKLMITVWKGKISVETANHEAGEKIAAHKKEPLGVNFMRKPPKRRYEVLIVKSRLPSSVIARKFMAVTHRSRLSSQPANSRKMKNKMMTPKDRELIWKDYYDEFPPDRP